MKAVEISEETLHGLDLIMCGLSCDHSGAEVYPNAIPIMNQAHKEIINLGNEFEFDIHGQDIL